MNRAQIVAGAAASGQRLDRFLCTELPLASRAGVRQLIEAGLVRVNGRRAVAGQRLAAGDTVAVAELPSAEAVPDADMPLVVCYEDAWIVAADKPAGVPAHPLRPGERGTLASALLARYPEMRGVGYSAREPGIVHRLDTDTSGLTLAARDAETFGLLRAQLERGEIDKRYFALCAGHPTPGMHEAWLLARGRKVSVRMQPFEAARLIRTELLTAETFGAHCLVEVRVASARRHQIRAHLAALGHPIVADSLYGGPEAVGLARHFLHASELRLSHPRGGQPLRIVAELPPELRAALQV